MEKITCYLVGFVVAIVLVVLFFGVKEIVADIKRDQEREFSSIARKEALEVKHGIWWYNINGFDKRVKELIDSKLAEKEGGA